MVLDIFCNEMEEQSGAEHVIHSASKQEKIG